MCLMTRPTKSKLSHAHGTEPIALISETILITRPQSKRELIPRCFGHNVELGKQQVDLDIHKTIGKRFTTDSIMFMMFGEGAVCGAE